MKRLLALALCAGLLAACGRQGDTGQAADQSADQGTAAPAAPQETQLVSGIDESNFDDSVPASQNFYQHVNGTWLAKTEIPADKSNYGAFTQLSDQAEKDERAIIEEAASGDFEPGTEMQQIGDLYSSFMDQETVDAKGIEPLSGEMAMIDGVTDREGLIDVMAKLTREGMTLPFDGYVTNDGKNPEQYIIYLYQSGLGLPDRDYYLDDADKFKKIRDEYVKHVSKMMDMAGVENPDEAAQTIMKLETRLAKNQWTRVESRDSTKTYNKRDNEKINAMLGSFDWPRYLDQAGIKNAPEFIVMQPSYFEAFGKAFDDVSVDEWKTYLKWHLVDEFAPYLSEPFVDQNFAFYGTVISGTPENRPRWKRGVSLVEDSLGMAVGKVYVDRHFPPEAKARMEHLVGNLIQAYHDSIQDLDWMGDETKQKALAKLAKFTPKIGYPDEWRDYSGLEIKPDDLMGNVLRSRAFDFDYQVGKLGQPVDRKEWHMTPQTVNAYYNPGMNEIVFPAAILQPPFFNMNADPAVNYGGIGAVIGHEIGHGFDDQGSKYDGDGRLENWWTDQDRAEFEKRTKALIEQYNQYCPLKDQCVNGALTIGENIGDLGGLTIAHEAWQIALDGEQPPVIDGLTGEQRFFMGWGQVWRRKYRDQELLRRLKTDPHSPSEYRCNGVVANVPAFYDAFNVTEGDKMYIAPDKRVSIW